MSEDWETKARETLEPMIRDSQIGLAIYHGESDPKQMLEMGYMVMLDKPIIVVTWDGLEIPENLRRVARHVVELHSSPSTEAGQEELQTRLAPLITALG